MTASKTDNGKRCQSDQLYQVGNWSTIGASTIEAPFFTDVGDYCHGKTDNVRTLARSQIRQKPPPDEAHQHAVTPPPGRNQTLMACASPLTAYRPASGGPLSFTQPRGRAASKIQLPCGQCILCRLEYARQNAVRITHEASLHDTNAFITLTYADEYLPLFNSLSSENKKAHPWQPAKDRNHLSKFLKRMRHEIGRFRYYAVGEYGDETKRPHYHLCLFGHDFTHEAITLRTNPTRLWTHPLLQRLWGLGHVSVGALTFQSAQYTAAYVTKKLNNKQQYCRVDEDTGELIPLVQPKAYMSRRPGLARPWLDAWGEQIVNHDRVVIDGKPQKPPRYYDAWLKAKHPEKEEERKERRRERATMLSAEDLRARAANAHARKKLQVKSI